MTRYTIKRGDTLSAIASRYGVTISALAAQNKIKDVNRITAGATITIPEKIVAKPADPKPSKPKKPSDAELGAAFRAALDALDALPEYQALEELLRR